MVGARAEPVEQFTLVKAARPRPVRPSNLVEMVEPVGVHARFAPTLERAAAFRDMFRFAVPAVALGGRTGIVRSRLPLERGDAPQAGDAGDAFDGVPFGAVLAGEIEDLAGAGVERMDLAGVDPHGREQGGVFRRKDGERVMHVLVT